jgi:hypothetical protein
MRPMSFNGYRFLGRAVWRGGRWYLRRRLPPRRTLVRAGLITGATVLAAAVVLRRAAD